MELCNLCYIVKYLAKKNGVLASEESLGTAPSNKNTGPKRAKRAFFLCAKIVPFGNNGIIIPLDYRS